MYLKPVDQHITASRLPQRICSPDEFWLLDARQI